MICPRCHERPTKKGYCKECRVEYGRIWRANHRKHPKGDLKGNYRRAEKDFDLPPITMCYLNQKGGMSCGYCKSETDFIGTRSTIEGKEDQWFCSKCKENIFVPHDVYSRLRIWTDASIRPNRERNPIFIDGNILAIFADYLPRAISG